MKNKNSAIKRTKRNSGISTECTRTNHKASRLGRKRIRLRLYSKNIKSGHHIQTSRIGPKKYTMRVGQKSKILDKTRQNKWI